jgi:hypothetical protein
MADRTGDVHPCFSCVPQTLFSGPQTKTESFADKKTEGETIFPGLKLNLSHSVGVIDVDFFEADPLPYDGLDLDFFAERHSIAD